jgi:hypothetical protein
LEFAAPCIRARGGRQCRNERNSAAVMTLLKQIETNRRNALKSTGPRAKEERVAFAMQCR